MTTMTAAVTTTFGTPPELDQVQVPQPGPGEVLVRVRAVGLCGSDLKINRGVIPTVTLPLIQGHEVAGEVAGQAAGLADGQRVALYIHRPCGICAWCRRGQTNQCRNDSRLGFERNGGLAEYVIARPQDLVSFGDGLAFESAAVSMDAVLTPWRAVHRRAKVQAGDYVLVVGAGGLGLNAVQIAVAAGAHVGVMDIAAARRDGTLELGAELAVAPEDAAELIEWSDGGVTAALEMSGSPDGFNSALAATRDGGTVVCCGYRPGTDLTVDWTRLTLAEMVLMGSRGGTIDDAREAVAAVERGEIRPLIAKTGSLADAPTFFDELAAGEGLGRLVVLQP